ncbi:MAG: hypothetical protein AB7Q97_01865 [Gammaproteobacteria bacterium]
MITELTHHERAELGLAPEGPHPRPTRVIVELPPVVLLSDLHAIAARVGGELRYERGHFIVRRI